MGIPGIVQASYIGRNRELAILPGSPHQIKGIVTGGFRVQIIDCQRVIRTARVAAGRPRKVSRLQSQLADSSLPQLLLAGYCL